MTQRQFTVGAVWVRRLLDALTAAGFDAKAYCRRRNWDLELLQISEERVPWADVVALWHTAARETGDPHLGLHAAARLPDYVAGPFGYAASSCPTLLDALKLMVRYQALHFDGNALCLDERDDRVAVRVSLPQTERTTPHQIEYVCVLLRKTCAAIVGNAFGLLEVHFRHGGALRATEHERIFGCPVYFGQPENAVLFAKDVVLRPSLFANPEVFANVRAIAERRLVDLQSPEWVRRVRRALTSAQPGSCRIEDVVRQLSVSRRSLQRKLAAEGHSFATVLDQVRRERALALIGRRDLPVAAIATQAGFAERGAFVRAFRRWTGQSPSEFRANSAGPGTGSAKP